MDGFYYDIPATQFVGIPYARGENLCFVMTSRTGGNAINCVDTADIVLGTVFICAIYGMVTFVQTAMKACCWRG